MMMMIIIIKPISTKPQVVKTVTSSTRYATSSTQTTLLSPWTFSQLSPADHASTLTDKNVLIRMLYKDLGCSQSCWTLH